MLSLSVPVPKGEQHQQIQTNNNKIIITTTTKEKKTREEKRKKSLKNEYIIKNCDMFMKENTGALRLR